MNVAARARWKKRLLLLAVGLLGFYLLIVREPYVKPREPPRVTLPPTYWHKYNPTKVDLHIGPRRFRVGVDYLTLTPMVGKHFRLAIVWPSMRTENEEVQHFGAMAGGKPGVWGADILEVEFQPVTFPDRYMDHYDITAMSRIDDIHADKGQGLYLKHGPLNPERGSALDRYWAIDPAVRTPLQKLPYAFDCTRYADPTIGGLCTGTFQLHPEVSVRIRFNKKHLKDWRLMYARLLEFIQSIEEPAS